MKKTAILLVISFLLSGCGIYSKYQRPESVKTDSLFGEFLPDDSASMADISWREFFTDPYLTALIAKGLENNTALQTAALNTAQAESALKSARLSWLPTLNLAPTGGVSEFNNWHNLTTDAQWTYTLSAACSWEIETFGKHTNTIRSAKSSAQAARDYEQAVRTGLISAIANQYYTLLMLDRQLILADSTRDRLARSVEVLNSMKNAGMVTDIAVSQMSAACYRVTASIQDIRRSISDLETSLCTTVRETPHSIERGTLAALAIEPKTGYPAAILSRRPDVRGAENALASAYYATNVARSKLYPSLTLSGIAGWTNDLGSTVINPGGLLLSAAGSLMQPIFNARGLRTNLEITKAEQEKALLAYQQAVLDAGAEVNNALTLYQTTTAKQQSRALQISALESVVRKSNLLMQNSSVTYLEVLTAEEELLTAKTAESQDTYDKIQALISLYRALGGGTR